MGDVTPPAWQPPVAAPPLLPPHPKRTGIIWFWPTLALITMAMGLIGLVDAHHYVDVGVYPAVALAITGVMLLVGSFYGRPGGLIALGFLSTLVLSAATVLGTFHFDGRTLDANPPTAATVAGEYSVHVGRVRLDLTDVIDPADLAGKKIDLHVNAGQVKVVVPSGINVVIHARMGFAGGITIPGYDGGGYKDHVTRHLTGTSPTTAPLDLDINVRVGQITVEQQ